MNKLISIIFLFLVLASVVYACPSETEFRLTLKSGLFHYLENPAESQLTIYEVKDLVKTYLMYNISSVNCSSIYGNESGLMMDQILKKADRIEKNIIPKCSDGTIYGECSTTMPKFCYSGTLMYMCYGPDMIIGNSDDCGCNVPYEQCIPDGSCKKLTINCLSNSSCGTSQFVGDYFCDSNNIRRNYIQFICHNPGLPTSSCNYTNESKLIYNCTLLGKACIGNNSVCQ